MINTKQYRIINRMKVTAIIPDDLVGEVKRLTKGKNITDSLIIALEDWTSNQKLKVLATRISKKPLKFKSGFTASKIRTLNRQ